MADQTDICVVDDAAWERAVAREAVVRRLVMNGSPDRAEFLSACRKLGLNRSRLYELIRAYKTRPVTSSLVTAPAGSRSGSRRLPDEIEVVISEAIESFFKSSQKPSIHALQKEVRRLCNHRGLRAPCWTSLRNRVAALDPAGLTAAREGAKAARNLYHPVPGAYHVKRIFEVVQIDHTLVDVIVVDRAYRQPLQRPWLTLAIDVASRMVAGFYLTLEPPSTLSVSLVIQHLVQPKLDWLEGLGIKASWPTAGLPESIHVDNAKEFRSKALRRGAEEHGISLQYRPIGAPHYGGHIERLIGTMMGAVHLLPGSTFSNIQDRGAYNSAAKSVMTLDELERWLALEITRYHAERHRSLGIPPIAAWQEAYGRRDMPLRQPYDPEGFQIDFLPSVERMVRRDGIHLFGLRYWDNILSLWAGRGDRQLRVSYDPRDLSTVFVRGPDGQRYPVRFADLRHPPITLAEHRRAQAVLRERGRSLEDEELIFAVIEEQRALVDAATGKTRKARRSAERRDRALSGVEPAAIEEKIPDHVEACDILDVPTFEVEEWS
ncbi:Mu transposase C-terminal domain-containing protein [Salipiger manganoxidans]|uniref:Mu transposase C-terminal domain-containing protein n=1 Tax=Salipiger marinus TaxID=555512 RepID=UPI001E3CAE41|nr:Mu transposase C-terminal domain-containing protein [Salipiger manganoxidans]MCD1619015.1 Mu transposase C-terminal domain-containing protein [Salipiger manganoxidans]